MTKTNIEKTTDWLKKNGYGFEVRDGSIYVDESITIQKNKRVSLAALAEVSGPVYVRDGATFKAAALQTVGHVACKTTIFGHDIEVYDGIGTATLSEKTRDGVTIRYCRKAKFEDGKLVGENIYVVSSGGHTAHGETISDAMSDLYFKTASRDMSQYQNMPMDIEAADEIERLRAIIQAALDPAFYKPDELAGAWEKWHSAVLRGGVK